MARRVEFLEDGELRVAIPFYNVQSLKEALDVVQEGATGDLILTIEDVLSAIVETEHRMSSMRIPSNKNILRKHVVEEDRYLSRGVGSELIIWPRYKVLGKDREGMYATKVRAERKHHHWSVTHITRELAPEFGDVRLYFADWVVDWFQKKIDDGFIVQDRLHLRKADTLIVSARLLEFVKKDMLGLVEECPNPEDLITISEHIVGNLFPKTATKNKSYQMQRGFAWLSQYIEARAAEADYPYGKREEYTRRDEVLTKSMRKFLEVTKRMGAAAYQKQKKGREDYMKKAHAKSVATKKKNKRTEEVRKILGLDKYHPLARSIK